MSSPASNARNGQSLGTAARDVADHATAIAKLELELATLELKRKLGGLAAGIGLGAGAALFAFFMLGFLLAAIAAGFATFLPVWAALLVTAGLLAVLTAALALLARGQFVRATPPLPEEAIREAKLTTEALKR